MNITSFYKFLMFIIIWTLPVSISFRGHEKTMNKFTQPHFPTFCPDILLIPTKASKQLNWCQSKTNVNLYSPVSTSFRGHEKTVNKFTQPHFPTFCPDILLIPTNTSKQLNWCQSKTNINLSVFFFALQILSRSLGSNILIIPFLVLH